MAAPTVQSIAEIMAQLNPIYDPQRKTLQEQGSIAQQQTQAGMSQLDALKTQSFKNIDQSAQNRGMFFSGFTPNEQASYLSTKYLPAVAGLQGKLADQRNTLAGQLASIDATVGKQALDTQNSQKQALAQYETEQAKLAQQMYLEQLKMQNRLQAARISASGSGGLSAYQAAQLAQQQAKQYTVTQKKNGAGYAFTGPGGAPVSMAQFVAGRNGGSIDINQVLDLLQNGSSYDQFVYRQAKATGLRDPAKLLQVIALEDPRNYYGFR